MGCPRCNVGVASRGIGEINKPCCIGHHSISASDGMTQNIKPPLFMIFLYERVVQAMFKNLWRREVWVEWHPPPPSSPLHASLCKAGPVDPGNLPGSLFVPHDECRTCSAGAHRTRVATCEAAHIQPRLLSCRQVPVQSKTVVLTWQVMAADVPVLRRQQSLRVLVLLVPGTKHEVWLYSVHNPVILVVPV